MFKLLYYNCNMYACMYDSKFDGKLNITHDICIVKKQYIKKEKNYYYKYAVLFFSQIIRSSNSECRKKIMGPLIA